MFPAHHRVLRFAFSFCLTIPLSLFVSASAQDAPAKSEAQDSPAQNSASAVEQDKELKDAIKKPDQNKAKATAAYMAGQAAQKKGELNEALERYREASELDPTAADPLRAQALLYRRMGRMQLAISTAEKAIELDSNDYRTRLELAVLRLSRQEIEPAWSMVEEALESKNLNRGSVDFVQLHTIRSRIALLKRDLAECANSYRVILEALLKPEDFNMDFRQHQTLVSDNATSFSTVGKVMLEVGDNKRALVAFEGQQRLEKNQAGEHDFWLALTQYRMDKLQDAKKNLDRFFETGQRTPQSLRLLADIDRANSESDQTRSHLEALAKDDRNSLVVMMFLGNLLIEEEDLEGAKKVFNDVLVDTGNVSARLGLVRIDIAERDVEGLLDSISKAIQGRIQLPELAPIKAELITKAPEFAVEVVEAAANNVQSSAGSMPSLGLFLLADIARSLEQELEPQEQVLLQATLDSNPPGLLGIEALDRLGFNLLLQNKAEESALKYEQLLETPGVPNEKTLEALYRLSQAQTFNEKYDRALDAIQAALKLSQGNPLLTYQLGWVQVQAKQYDEAKKTLAEASRLSQGNADLEFQVQLLLGDLFVRTKEFEEGIQAYQKILDNAEQSDENQKRTRMRLSNAYVQTGDMEQGEKYLEEVYEAYPDDVGVNNDLGYLYADQGKNLEQAEKMIRLAVDAEPENAAYLDSLGWVLYRQEKYEEAAEVLEKANSDPAYRDSTIIEHLGDVYSALKQQEKAIEKWEDALKVETESDPSDEKVVNRLRKKLEP